MQNRQYHPIPRRATAEYLPTHRAGHSSGIHPEDEPYLTAERRRYPANPFDLADDLDYPDESARRPTSARRWTTTEGQQVIRQGNRQIIIHEGAPPRRRRRPHWLVISGMSMMVLLFHWVALTLVSTWWSHYQLDSTYEFPRASQADAIIYPGDTTQHPTHYLFLNLQGTVLIIELPHGDSAKAKMYNGPTLFTANADQVPITGEFKVVNGKVEMLAVPIDCIGAALAEEAFEFIEWEHIAEQLQEGLCKSESAKS